MLNKRVAGGDVPEENATVLGTTVSYPMRKNTDRMACPAWGLVDGKGTSGKITLKKHVPDPKLS